MKYHQYKIIKKYFNQKVNHQIKKSKINNKMFILKMINVAQKMLNNNFQKKLKIMINNNKV